MRVASATHEQHCEPRGWLAEEQGNEERDEGHSQVYTSLCTVKPSWRWLGGGVGWALVILTEGLGSTHSAYMAVHYGYSSSSKGTTPSSGLGHTKVQTYMQGKHYTH